MIQEYTYNANLLSFGRHPSPKCNGFINPLCNFHALCHSSFVASLVGNTPTFKAALDGVRMVELFEVPYLLEPRIVLWDWVWGVVDSEWTVWWCGGCRSMVRRRVLIIIIFVMIVCCSFAPFNATNDSCESK